MERKRVKKNVDKFTVVNVEPASTALSVSLRPSILASGTPKPGEVGINLQIGEKRQRLVRYEDTLNKETTLYHLAQVGYLETAFGYDSTVSHQFSTAMTHLQSSATWFSYLNTDPTTNWYWYGKKRGWSHAPEK